MQNFDLLQRPVIEAAIGGTVIEKLPSEFCLMTQSGFHSVMSRLLYPAGAETGAAGDKITVSLASNDKTELYFTGVIYSANVHGQYRELLLTDSYKKLCCTEFAAAYRKEKAANILDDILGAAGISEKTIICPDVDIARFSTQTIPARLCIDLLIDALGEHGAEGLTYFFDEKDVFHFGTEADAGRNEGGAFSFETGGNILRSGSGWIEVLPRPVRHTQNITVDSKAMLTAGTNLTISRNLSRLTLWIKEGG
jgi:hypothetical protein